MPKQVGSPGQCQFGSHRAAHSGFGQTQKHTGPGSNWECSPALPMLFQSAPKPQVLPNIPVLSCPSLQAATSWLPRI